MAPYKLSKSPEESIVICSLYPDWHMAQDLDMLMIELNDMLARVKYPIYLILDLSDTHFEMNDLVMLANETARGKEAFTHHSNLRGFLLVSGDPTIGLMAQGMRTQTFGFAPVSAHGCMDEALDAARVMLKRE